MSNVAGKAYAMNVLTPMRPRRTALNTFIFIAARALPDKLAGLLGLSIIHFARWVMIRRDQWPDLGQGPERLVNDYMMFCSNFNGTWDQYIDAFSDGLPNGLDMFWFSSTKYPKSIPITPFKDYIRANQIDTNYYYNATPGSGQRDIKCAMRVRLAVLALAEAHRTATPATFATLWREALVQVQNDLGSPGFAPVASNDTANADRHRQPLIKARWGGSPADMPTLDGGHYFLTTLLPVKVEPQVGTDGGFTSPSHVLREALATWPTAQQSPACVEAGFNSPFSRCTRTHFVRAVLIEQPMFNGRDGGNALVQGLRNVNLLAHQPVDRLSRPYLMFCADFDARVDEGDGGIASWATGLWERTEPELRAVFAFCLGFDAVRDGASFAAWLVRCQIETTMSFNDYYVPTVDLHGYTMRDLAVRFAVIAAALVVLSLVLIGAMALSPWWLLAFLPAATVVGGLAVLRMLWVKGSQPFPVGANTDLPAVLKALHVQQRFALFAADVQGTEDAALHARFGEFLAEVRPDDLTAPTQPPGVIRSDGTPLVVHQPVPKKAVEP